MCIRIYVYYYYLLLLLLLLIRKDQSLQYSLDGAFSNNFYLFIYLFWRPLYRPLPGQYSTHRYCFG